MVVKIIMNTARTSEKGSYGDGKIFITKVEEVYTVSSGVKEFSRAKEKEAVS